MKKLAVIALAALMLVPASGLRAQQKKALDHDVYDGWQSVAGAAVSPDGQIVIYEITPQEGDSEFHAKNLRTGAEICIERGSGAKMSWDGKWAVLKIKAPFQETLKAKRAGKTGDKLPADSLAYVNLRTMELTNLGKTGAWKMPSRGEVTLAYETEVNKSKRFVILDPATGAVDTLAQADKYTFDTWGKQLVVSYKKDSKDSLSTDRIVLYNLPGRDSVTLDEGRKLYSTPSFSIDGSMMAFLASADSNKTGSKNCAVILSELITKGKGRKAVTTRNTREIIAQGAYEGLPEGWIVSEAAKPFFTGDSKYLILGVGERVPEKDSTIHEFESAQLDVWNWDIYKTPPMQKAEGGRTRLCKASLKLDSGKLTLLQTEADEMMDLVAGGKAGKALMVDRTPYRLTSTWDSNDDCDLYIVNLADGSRTLLCEKFDGIPAVSPTGRYHAFFSSEDGGWYCTDFEKGVTAPLTKGLDGIFWEDEDDHPMPKMPIKNPQWLEGDKAVILTEKHDIWMVSPDGKKAVCLTAGEGRKNNIQFRTIDLKPSLLTAEQLATDTPRAIGAKDDICLTTFNTITKENGFALVNAAKPGLKACFTAPKTYLTPAMARENGTVIYRKGDLKNSPDLYVSADFFGSEQKLTSINPQQAGYNWADVQLVHWTAYDGTKLDGLLYTPEDLDPSKKYPMMIYFYEKNSETLYRYMSPAPSASIINPVFFASRGYVVFIPDIVYTVGHPGESAYNCICSGAEAMCEQFGFVDKDRMAIQGQSWGGYQTAWLVTRTNMFAAAGVGAPVGNMTSAYGGVRWESGHVRAMQYEHGQSRIGKSLWDEGGLELYIENSPVFHTQNVTTPVLIMHNDADGAVPWYQGIEFFMALRRFQHPAWMLQYNGEAHNLMQRRNRKDYTIRLSQFFDHYLLGSPLPAWMKTGVPYSRKGNYYGLEYIEAE